MLQDNRTELQLDSTELSSLLTIANREHGNASFLALNIYNQNKGILDIACHSQQENNNERRLNPASVIPANSSFLPKGNYVKVYPNPTSDRVGFEYSLSAIKTTAVLTITTLTGQSVFSTNLSNQKGIVYWNARAIAAGTYTYKVVARQRLLEAGKISVMH